MAKLYHRFVKGWSEPPFWALDRMRSALLTSGQPDRETIENDFGGYVQGALKRDGIVFACVLATQLVFSEARLLWRPYRKGVPGGPGDLFGDAGLALLERPWRNGYTRDLLARMEVDRSLAGNFYATVTDDRARYGTAATGPGRRIAVMRPDRVTIVAGSLSGDPYALDAQPVGYLYEPPATGASTSKPVLLSPEQVCHYAPIPDPEARWRGMSWLTPVLREIEADRAATTHKLKFFENGASLSAIASFSPEIGVEEFNAFVESFDQQHKGVDNAYKTLFVGGGADITLRGADLRQLDFKNTQGTSETRISAAARVPAVILGISEGLQGSSLNAGNAGIARRTMADGLIRPLWGCAAASLYTLVADATPPTRSGETRVDLSYDDRHVAFLREDRGDVAGIQTQQAAAMAQLVTAGWTKDSIVKAVQAEDWALLVDSGLTSVQLLPPGTTTPTSNGSSAPATAPAG